MSRPRALNVERRTIGRKMATVDAMAMAADRKAIFESGPMAQLAGAKSRATAVGKQAWKTIAPEMLPMASVSLPYRTQRMLLSFSGSSVAIGAMTRANNVALTPRPSAMVVTVSTKMM